MQTITIKVQYQIYRAFKELRTVSISKKTSGCNLWNQWRQPQSKFLWIIIQLVLWVTGKEAGPALESSCHMNCVFRAQWWMSNATTAECREPPPANEVTPAPVCLQSFAITVPTQWSGKVTPWRHGSPWEEAPHNDAATPVTQGKTSSILSHDYL